MRVRYTTESGSQYTIDYEKKTWERSKGEGAAEIRSGSGTYNDIDVDKTIRMLCPPINPPYPRFIESTPITAEEALDDV